MQMSRKEHNPGTDINNSTQVSGKEKPGLIMVQIDGLSKFQFSAALKTGKMPFLNSLLNDKNYELKSFYSGIPSSTPAVQAELFYGVKGAVPGFGFYSRETGEFCNTLSHKIIDSIEKKLKDNSVGLLEGGSAYSDTYTAGALKASFCVTNKGFGGLWKKAPWKVPWLVLLNSLTIARTIVLFIIEIVLALVDLFRGLIGREHFLSELQFIPARVGVSVVLRELIVASVRFDISRGVPVIHCNFLGYDELSHRRGPSSNFAHWTLKGIDNAIRRIYLSIKESKNRRYELWIYSDHGQEHSLSYPLLYKKTISSAVNEIVRMEVSGNKSITYQSYRGIQKRRLPIFGSKFLHKPFVSSSNKKRQFSVMVAAVGPMGHVYLHDKVTNSEKMRIAKAIVEKAHVPAVLIADDNGEALAWSEEGIFKFPENAAKILGSDHPFLEEVSKDLLFLVNHPDAGDLVLLGWHPGKMPISFPIESGSHAGPGREETHGFCLLPGNAPVQKSDKEYLRALDIRKAAIEYLQG
jgi:hypothetical protein